MDFGCQWYVNVGSLIIASLPLCYGMLLVQDACVCVCVCVCVKRTEGVWKLTTQFFCEPKTDLKIEVY